MISKQLFFVTLLFYLALWVFNPGNYLVLCGFLILFYFINIITSDYKISMLLATLASSVVFTGKTYLIPIIPSGIFDRILYPDGYQLAISITPNHILAFVLSVILVRELYFKRISAAKLLKFPNYLVIVLFLWNLAADYFGSSDSTVSMLVTALGYSGAVTYFCILAFGKVNKKLWSYAGSILLALVVFESLISFHQFIHKSGIGKQIEFMKGIETPGRAPDEDNFAYRPDGTFDHANTLGMNLVYWLVISLAIYISRFKGSGKIIILSQPKSLDDRLFLVSILLGGMSLIMTLSRGAWIGFVIAILTSLYLLEKVYKYRFQIKINIGVAISLGIIVLLASLLFVIPRAEKSIYSFVDGGGVFRKDQAVAVWQIAINNPVFGVGSAMVPKYGLEYLPKSLFSKEPLDIHIWYLSALANHGIPSVMILLVFILLSANKVYKDLLNKKTMLMTEDFIRIGYIGLVASFFIMGVFSANSGEGNLLLLTALLYEENN